MHPVLFSLPSKFLSTPSARRATLADVPIEDEAADFYPRPPRGGRPGGSTLMIHP